MKRLPAIAVALAALTPLPASAAPSWQVRLNPYGPVDFTTTERILGQHHYHMTNAQQVTEHEAAGYNGIPWGNFSGGCFVGVPYNGTDGYWGFSPWPPADFGAPAIPGGFTNLKFYLSGQEETGELENTGNNTPHVWSYGMTGYIESIGCTNCPPATMCRGSAPESDTYFTAQEKIDLIRARGGVAELAHSTDTSLENLGAIEIFNNFYHQLDVGAGNTANQDAWIATWNTYLDQQGGDILGVSDNDFITGPAALLGQTGAGLCWGVVKGCAGAAGEVFGAADLDKGKQEVFAPTMDSAAYDAAYRYGSSVAIVEYNATKLAYPKLNSVLVTSTGITIGTIAGTETVRWIKNGGALAGTSLLLPFSALADTDTWVRAELRDGAGRIAYLQAFQVRLQSPIQMALGSTRILERNIP